MCENIGIESCVLSSFYDFYVYWRIIFKEINWNNLKCVLVNKYIM